MSAVLAREVFSTSRLAEFCSRQQLISATGHSVEYWPLYVTKELVDNALDNCEEHGIAPVVAIEIATDRITVADNGSGLPGEVLDRILDYGSRTSSREAYISPTRGAQGNALQTVLAMPFALGEVGRVTVEAHGQAHEIEFRIDEIHQVPEITRSTGLSLVKDGTRITVWWPELASSILLSAKPQFLQIAEYFTTLNPHLTIKLTVNGELTAFTGASDPQWVKWRPSDPTSPHWYDAERLRRLIAAYIANGKGERPVREFIAEFAGLSGSAKQKAVLDATGLARASLANLCPDDRFDDRLVTRLLAAMQDQAKPIKPDALGIIGRGHWQCSAEEYGGDLDTFVYRKLASVSDGLPWIVEAAFCLLTEADERVIARGLTIHQFLVMTD